MRYNRGMGAHDLFRILALLFALFTAAILIATGRVKNGWMIWLAVPVLSFAWYWVLVCFYMGYYMWHIRGVQG